MSWVGTLWPMMASAGLTLAAVHVLVWARNRTAWANLLFSVTAGSSAVFAFFELWMTRAATPAEFATAMRWGHVPLFFWMVSIAWFVRLYLGTGRLWLAWTVCGLRAFALLPNFLAGQNLNYREITGLRHVPFLGELVTVADGARNPWMLVGHLGVLALIVFVGDASLAAWRRGDRRKALLVGGSIELFVVGGFANALVVLWGNVQAPIVFSVPYLGLVLAMGYELSRDVLRASELGRELAASAQETLQLRQEIAHAGRVSMMGQLASALAHEINQPLGAILRNTEAAELFLQHESPDLDEIRAILADIRKDDRRAGDVIDRMRGLLKRQDLDRRRLDVGEIVGDVVALLRSDAAARQVKLNADLAGGLPPVRADRVHTQQVLLNLMINGMDALDGVRRGNRRVNVNARVAAADTVEVAVHDSGRGIPADTLPHVFDPFFTTKAHGMGMGLSISRTIVEANGGRLWAENGQDGGAVFRFTLPIAEGALAE